jgi:hypothetical protein
MHKKPWIHHWEEIISFYEVNAMLTIDEIGREKDKVIRGFLWYIISPYAIGWKGLVCNSKWPICKDPAVEIYSIPPFF